LKSLYLRCQGLGARGTAATEPHTDIKKWNYHPTDPPSVKFFLDIAPFGALEQKLQFSNPALTTKKADRFHASRFPLASSFLRIG
jgi:hypothetical protein